MSEKKANRLFDNGKLSVYESIEKNSGQLAFQYNQNRVTASYALGQFERLEVPCSQEDYYFGYTLSQVVDSGRDILAELALKRGEPGFEDLAGIMPPLRHNTYGFLSGSASWSGVIVDAYGNIFPQMNGQINRPAAIFTPVELDVRLNKSAPIQMLLEAYLPVMVSLFKLDSENEQMRTIAFVEHGDPDRDPLVWMRATWYSNGEMEPNKDMYFCVTQSRERKKQMIEPDAFWNALYTTVVYWKRFIARSSASAENLSIPDKELETLVRGTLVSSTITFTGEHPHYGHREYGCEQHDNFPPTLITSFEAAAVWGQISRARGMIDHLMKYSVDVLGRFTYRQGDTYNYGAAAVEYGQLLWVLNQYWYVMEKTDDMEGLLETIRYMGDILIESREECPYDSGLRLVRMCAEADTHGRIYFYINNNLWAIRGLRALSEILRRHQLDASLYEAQADELNDELRRAIQAHRVPTEYGNLVPFKLYYNAMPLTLSNTKSTAYPVSQSEYDRYIVPLPMGEDSNSTQEYSENSYANYRFYLEMLSSRLLEPQEEDAIVKMREDLGGEMLGMTRFMDKLDNWPVFNYARYLLETDRIDKFLMILYAHALYSGVPHLMVYFEQFQADGKAICPDCVPALLSIPMLTAWMFGHVNTADGALHLLHGIPKRWFAAPEFHGKDIYTPVGNISVSVKATSSMLRIAVVLPQRSPTASGIYLHIRCMQTIAQSKIIEGSQWVEDICGNVLKIRDDCPKAIEIKIKRTRK